MVEKYYIDKNPDTAIFNKVILKNCSDYNLDDIRTNRSFDKYDFPNLEACSLNSHKKSYVTANLIKDLSKFFKYIPKDELNRLVHTFFWLLSEALKNYGHLHFRNFGRFTTYDKLTKYIYNVGTGEKYSNNKYKINRQIHFQPHPQLRELITPRNLRYMGLNEHAATEKTWPGYFGSFVAEKKHRRKGQLLFQEAYDAMFHAVPYSPEYVRALAVKEIRDESLYI